MKTTDELLKILKNTRDIDSFLNENSDWFLNMELCGYLNELSEKKGLRPTDVIADSNLNNIYVYKILSGERVPGRDKLICLCFGMHMSIEEAQLALRLAGHSPLYVKVRRDSIIIFALNNGASLMDCNETLYDLGEDILE